MKIAPVFALFVLVSVARGTSPLETVTLTVDGAPRTALLYVPPNAATTPMPLVFVFHGHGGSSRNAERTFQTDKLWPEAISVYPQGLPTPGKLLDADGKMPGWQAGSGAQGDRDLHFFDALLAKIKAEHAVDAKRIYCCGHSNGAGFTYLLWRTRGDLFAAVAPSSAAAVFAPQLSPKPAMILGGRSDAIVKFDWQQRTMDVLRSVNGCGTTGTAYADKATEYPSKTGTPLVTYIHDGGHAMEPAEAGLIVKFFKQHPGATTRP